MKYIYILYQYLIVLPIFWVYTMFTAIMSVVCIPWKNGAFIHWIQMSWSRLFFYLNFLPVHVEGYENISPKQSYVFVSNHTSMLDVWLIYGWLPNVFKWMMKKELERVPLFGSACRAARFVMVDNANAGTVRRTCREAAALMREGYSICIFPEGSRSWDGRMTAFHKGGFVLAKACGFPIVPITVNGSFEALPRAKGLSLTSPSHLSITIHEPIPADASCEDLMARVFDDIHRDLDQKYQ